MDIETYSPVKKRTMHKEEAVPVLMDVGNRFVTLGGLIGFFISSFLTSFRSFFKAKKKVREFKSRYERTLDLS